MYYTVSNTYIQLFQYRNYSALQQGLFPVQTTPQTDLDFLSFEGEYPISQHKEYN